MRRCARSQPLITVFISGLVLAASAVSRAATGATLQSTHDDTPDAAGRAVYERACAACHGVDGRGVPKETIGFDVPVPDLTDCSFVTVEPDEDWMAVSHDGGPARGFDRRMPAFGGALGSEAIREVIDYMRGFCPSRAWPHGNLNLPRALVTEKAFPENEFVLTTNVVTSGIGEVGNELLYEQRIGARSQYEVVVPLLVSEGETGEWQRGVGDVAIALKHALYHDRYRGHILSVAGEFILPTGKESQGLGGGVTIFEPFVAFGQILPAGSFAQFQAGLELPFDTDRAGREAFWRAALGKTFTQGGFGRAWSPIVEILAARELESGATVHWDLVPQMQVTLNRRQHIMINAGVRFPLNDRSGRTTQVIAYFLWDWFDGGLLEGWR
jgi:mono/diheme cytochrome c family protein